MKTIRRHAPVGIAGLVYEDAPAPTRVFGDVLVEEPVHQTWPT